MREFLPLIFFWNFSDFPCCGFFKRAWHGFGWILLRARCPVHGLPLVGFTGELGDGGPGGTMRFLGGTMGSEPLVILGWNHEILG